MGSGRTTLDLDALDRAALTILSTLGPDGLSIPRLARSLDVTTGPIYRRFDTGEDVIYDLWSRRLRPHLSEMSRGAVEAARHPGSVRTVRVEHELRAPSEESLAVLHVLATARRMGTVGDQLRREFADDLERLCDDEAPLPPVLVAAHLSLLLGSWLMAVAWSSIGVHSATTLGAFSTAYHDTSHRSADCHTVAYRPPPPLITLTGDSAIDDLRLATFRVVSMYGCASATANRISRVAERSVTSAYRQLGGKDALVMDAIHHALRADLGFSGNESLAAMSRDRRDRLELGLQALRHQVDERNRENRLFILEVLLATHGDPTLRITVHRWLEGIRANFGATVRTYVPAERVPTVLGLWEAKVGSGLGAMVISTVLPDWIGRIDLMPAVSANVSLTDDLRRTTP